MMAASAQAQPMSAIDWLTDSVSTKPKEGGLIEEPLTGTTNENISVQSLERFRVSAVGLKSPIAFGLDDNLWERSDLSTVIRLITRTKTFFTSPAVRDLFIDLLIAGAPLPLGETKSQEFLLARVDKLLEIGALEPALRILEQADLDDPQIFRRWFDARLLTGTEDAACRRLIKSPDLSPTFPTTIFCLARTGDWDAAALTLDTAEALGLVTASEDALLLRFLDETNSAEDGALTLPTQITPLVFRLFEAVGEPISAEILPRAFSHFDLAPENGWKAQITAAERLTAAGVLSESQLFRLYREQAPAASGGIWERTSAIQKLDAALEVENPSVASEALPVAWSLLSTANLSEAMATHYSKSLNGVSLEGGARDLALRIALLTGPEDEQLELARSIESLSFAAALTQTNAALPPAITSLEERVAAGLRSQQLQISLQQLIDENRTGEAALIAINLFQTGAAGDADDLITALRMLRKIGLERTARQASLEYLLLERRG